MLDDGTRPFAPHIAPDQRRSLVLTSSEDVTIEASVVDPVGGAYRPALTDFLELNARSASRPIRQLFAVRSTLRGQLFVLQVLGNTTKPIPAQHGTYDLWLICSAGRSCVIPLSELVLRPSALGNNYL